MSNLLKDDINLMKEYHFEKNTDIILDKITLGSHIKVWWKCANGHEWEKSVKDRTAGNSCPYCCNQRVLADYNDLATLNPELAKEWNYEKNEKLMPNQVVLGSEKKVWWKCSKRHEWQASIYNRNKGSGCPYCSNFSVLLGYNDLATTNPDLAQEWNYERNGELKPTSFTAGSHKKVWWKCSKGHEWVIDIKTRSQGNKCPFCSNKKILVGYNDLLTTNPKLAEEWNYERNGELKPTSFTAGSQKKVWWKCNLGHEWEASIDSRSRGYECPYCKHSKVLKGYNDLLTTYPEIAKQWDFEKNKEKPDEVLAGSNIKKYWFLCPKGHSYDATPLERKRGSNCPICTMERHISFPEKAICYYLKQNIQNVKESYRNSILGRKEIDIYLPNFRIGIEYDGRAWHKNPSRDLEKDYLCTKNDIILIRIREYGCFDYVSDSIKKYITPYNMQELNEAIKFIFRVLNERFGVIIKEKIDVNRDRVAILEQMSLSEKRNSIAAYCPKIKDFWDVEKNGKITPEQIPHASYKKVFLKCDKGHEWEVAVSNFPSYPWCPYCSGRKVLTGFNDLFTTNPKLASLWSIKNKLNPRKIKSGCNSKALWYCPTCGGEYEMKVADKAKGYGCPYCTGHRVLKGFNDLETLDPELAKEWNYEKNYPLTPADFTKGSNKKVWWKCKVCNHEWETNIASRSGPLRRGCPKCENKRIAE